MTIPEVAAVVGGRLHTIDRRGRLAPLGEPTLAAVAGPSAVVIDNISADSRQLADATSTLFVALVTDTSDGHRYLGAAMEAHAGAVMINASFAGQPARSSGGEGQEPQGHGVAAAIVVDDTWSALRALAAHVRGQATVRTVAVTGSVGKTTVKDFTASLLAEKFRTWASPASFNNELGVPLTLLTMPVDCEALVCEIGARAPGDIALLAGIVAPDVAIVTAVAPAHLGPFGSIEAIAATKAELVRSLGPRGVAVLNGDDPRVAAMAAAAPATLTVSVQDASADVYARTVVMRDDARAVITLDTPWGVVETTVPVAGRHQVVNAMLAVAAAGHLGVPVADMARGLAHSNVSQWRGQLLELDGGITVIDDAYNANPTSMAAALDTLAIVGRERRTVAVLGEMAELGPDSPSAHQHLGEQCQVTGVDVVVAVGAQTAALAQGARAAGHRQVVQVDDGQAASRWLAAYGQPGDVVLVKASRVAGLDRVVAELRRRGLVPAVASADDDGES